MNARRLGIVVAAAVAFSLALPAPGAHAEDVKKEKKSEKKPAKGKKNQAYIVPNFAAYNLTSIGLAPVTSNDRNVEAEKLFREQGEAAFGNLSYKLQGSSYLMELIRKNGAEPAFLALQRAVTEGAVLDSATLGTVARQVPVEAMLFTHQNTWQRQVVDQWTRGQSFTQVGADFALVSLKDGVTLWRGSFQEKGDGAFNDPSTAEITQRDATGNSVAKQAQLEPPSYVEVVERLMTRVAGTLPKPASASTP